MHRKILHNKELFDPNITSAKVENAGLGQGDIGGLWGMKKKRYERKPALNMC